MYMSKQFKQPTRPKITKNFDNEELVKGTVNLPSNLYEALRKRALERGVTMGSIIRKALEKYMATKRLEMEEPEFRKKAFLEFLDEFTDEDGDRFEIEGAEGFLAQVEERILDPSKVWSEDVLKETAKRYAIGFKGYFEAQDLDEHIERSSDAMKLTPQQKETWTELLKSEIGETEAESEEEEESEAESEEEEEW